LYDSNALWQKYTPENFKIILINNGGGDIFNFIPGPSNTPALEEFFVTKHNYNARNLAEMYHFNYQKVNNLQDLKKSLQQLFNHNSKPQLLEIDTRHIDNASILKAYFNFLKSS
jgi:2-succinyl-5-enolpyruvyl-6-hydroxy-3-cyclohexene-1-carboxylate synthase